MTELSMIGIESTQPRYQQEQQLPSFCRYSETRVDTLSVSSAIELRTTCIIQKGKRSTLDKNRQITKGYTTL